MKDAAQDALTAAVNESAASVGDQGFGQLASLAQEFSAQWQRLVTDVDDDGVATQAFPLAGSWFADRISGRIVSLGAVDLLGLPADHDTALALAGLTVTLPGPRTRWR